MVSISLHQRKTHGFWELQNSLLSGIHQPEGSSKIMGFLSNCDEASKIESILVGRESHLVKHTKPNVKKLNEVEKRTLQGNI